MDEIARQNTIGHRNQQQYIDDDVWHWLYLNMWTVREKEAKKKNCDSFTKPLKTIIRKKRERERKKNRNEIIQEKIAFVCFLQAKAHHRIGIFVVYTMLVRSSISPEHACVCEGDRCFTKQTNIMKSYMRTMEQIITIFFLVLPFRFSSLA